MKMKLRSHTKDTKKPKSPDGRHSVSRHGDIEEYEKDKWALMGLLSVRTPTRMTFPKLKEGLFPAIGDKIRITRKYDGVIEIDRCI